MEVRMEVTRLAQREGRTWREAVIAERAGPLGG
jgi:hypothetical protein